MRLVSHARHIAGAVFAFAFALATLSPARAQLFGDAASPAPNSEAAATIVVFNTNDPDSAELARFYAGKRGIAKEHLLGLDCPVKEEISRAEYDDTIAEPLRAAFQKNGWWQLYPKDSPLGHVERNHIRFVALMRGVPLKVAVTVNYPGDDFSGNAQISAHNEASVDSEIAALGAFTRVISGAMSNPFYRSFARILDSEYPELMLVCRLDAPTPEIVKRMITDSIAAEREGLRGWAYVDARNTQNAGFVEGDRWLYAAARELRKRGLPVNLDNGEGLFPEGYPMRDVAFYLGWYAENVSGPFARSDFRLTRGAVAIHIHSFSAVSLRDPRKGWAAPLLASGAAATLGNVYEPFLILTPQLDIFTERLLAGFTFAESAWMSQRVTSWQSTFVGDPLYRPFRFLNDLADSAGTAAWDDYRKGAKMWFQERATGDEALRTLAAKGKSGTIWEGLALLQLTTSDGQDAALAAFREARKAYSVPDDILRAGIHEIILLQGMKRDTDARALAEKLSETFPKARAIEVIRLLVPPPAPPPPKPG